MYVPIIKLGRFSSLLENFSSNIKIQNRPLIGHSRIFHGEFDPGSELTLVACLSHASRARKLSSESE